MSWSLFLVFVYTLQIESLNIESWWDYKKCEKYYNNNGRISRWVFESKMRTFKENEEKIWDFWSWEVKVYERLGRKDWIVEEISWW